MFFIREDSSSVEQFKKDFFEYPPNPLSEMEENIKFNTTRIDGLGERFYKISRIIKGLKSKDTNIIDLLKYYDDDFLNSFENFKKSYGEAKREFQSKPKFIKIMKFSIFLLMSPIFLILIFIIIFGFFIKSLRKMPEGIYGFYNPVFQGEREIVIMDMKIKDAGINCDHIISHEHIHLLQDHYFKDRNLKQKRNFHTPKVKSLLNDEFSDDSFIEYFFSVNEVEARLHEIVCSYYREKKSLPLNYRGFINLLIKAEKIGPVALYFIKRYDRDYVEFDFKGYPVSDHSIIVQLVDILIAFSDHEKSYRFISEVLPVMYGNLLVIYGDRVSSTEYMKTIPNKSFYKYLYCDL